MKNQITIHKIQINNKEENFKLKKFKHQNVCYFEFCLWNLFAICDLMFVICFTFLTKSMQFF